MRAAVETDETTRVICIRIVGGPVLDVSQSWHRRPRKVRVDQVRIGVFNGETDTITVSGGVLLRNGDSSQAQRGLRHWTSHTISTAPELVQRLWREAPFGITVWHLSNEEN